VRSVPGGNGLIIVDVIGAGDSQWCRLWRFVAAVVVHSNEFFVEFVPLLNEVGSDGRGNCFHKH